MGSFPFYLGNLLFFAQIIRKHLFRKSEVEKVSHRKNGLRKQVTLKLRGQNRGEGGKRSRSGWWGRSLEGKGGDLWFGGWKEPALGKAGGGERHGHAPQRACQQVLSKNVFYFILVLDSCIEYRLLGLLGGLRLGKF